MGTIQSPEGDREACGRPPPLPDGSGLKKAVTLSVQAWTPTPFWAWGFEVRRVATVFLLTQRVGNDSSGGPRKAPRFLSRAVRFRQ